MTPKNSAKKQVVIISAGATFAVPTQVLKSAAEKRSSASDRRTSLVPQPTEKVTTVDLEVFRANLESTTGTLSDLFESTFEKPYGDFQLDQVDISLEISADGKVGFLGSSVGLKGSSSITLSFKRKK